VSMTGARKAAMLLRNLDPSTAAELLRSAEPEMLTEIAVEVACLDRNGGETGAVSGEPIREFFGLLNGRRPLLAGEDLAREILQNVLGEQGSEEVLSQVDNRLKEMDPFRRIRSSDADAIAEALAGESAQAASAVLSELPARKSAELLGLLDEGTRDRAVACMAGAQEISPAARLCIAEIVEGRLEQVAKDRAMGRGAGRSRQRLRKVAVLLRGLEVDLRNQMVESLTEQDSENARLVQELMVTWDDINLISERSVQAGLMSVESGKLALALVEADERIVERIRENISERAKAMLDEEASLLSSPRSSEVEQAREEILNVFREMNTRGEIQFEEN